MNFLEVFCHNRKTTILVNIEKIIFLKQVKITGSEKEICQLFVEGINDGRGEIEVHLSIDEVKKLINGEDRKPAGFRVN